MLAPFGGAGLLCILTVISESLKGVRPSGAEYQPVKVYHDQASLTQFGSKTCDVSMQPLTSHCCHPLVCAASCDVSGCLDTSHTLPPPFLAAGGQKLAGNMLFSGTQGGRRYPKLSGILIQVSGYPAVQRNQYLRIGGLYPLSNLGFLSYLGFLGFLNWFPRFSRLSMFSRYSRFSRQNMDHRPSMSFIREIVTWHFNAHRHHNLHRIL